jgi:hypothetical protein
LLFRCRPSLRGHNEEFEGVLHWWWVLGIMEESSEKLILESDRGAPKRGSPNDWGWEINVDAFPVRMISLLWIFCHKWIVSLHNTSLIIYWSD